MAFQSDRATHSRRASKLASGRYSVRLIYKPLVWRAISSRSDASHSVSASTRDMTLCVFLAHRWLKIMRYGTQWLIARRDWLPRPVDCVSVESCSFQIRFRTKVYCATMWLTVWTASICIGISLGPWYRCGHCRCRCDFDWLFFFFFHTCEYILNNYWTDCNFLLGINRAAVILVSFFRNSVEILWYRSSPTE